jgi:GTPase SAR1 family protein
VYDVTQRHSFSHVKNWFERARQLGGSEIEAVLVGNKIDLEGDRKVSYEEGDQLASELQVPFVETSALTGNNVEQAFVCMTANIKR